MLHEEISEKEAGTIFAPRAVHHDPMSLLHLGLDERVGLWQDAPADMLISGLWRRIGRQWHAGIGDASHGKILWLAQQPIVDGQDGPNAPRTQGCQIPRFPIRPWATS